MGGWEDADVAQHASNTGMGRDHSFRIRWRLWDSSTNSNDASRNTAAMGVSKHVFDFQDWRTSELKLCWRIRLGGGLGRVEDRWFVG
jgi:hypothetical protein